jgi:hypothetical protein
MNLGAYDDMMGLEFGEYEGLADGLFNPEVLKQAVIATGAGGAAALAVTYGAKSLAGMVGLDKITNPLLRTAVVSGVALLTGLFIGRQVMKTNMNVGIGITGAVGGLAMANLIDAAYSQFTGNPRITSSLGDTDYMSGNGDGMSALAALEAGTTNVNAQPGAFSGFEGPQVTNEQLMGLEAATVQMETLGGYGPWMS